MACLTCNVYLMLHIAFGKVAYSFVRNSLIFLPSLQLHDLDNLTPEYTAGKMQEMPGLIGVTCCQCNAATNTHCYWSAVRQ